MHRVDRFKSEVRQKRFLAESLRSWLSALLMFTVFLGPYTFAGDAHAREHQSHSSMGHHDHSTTGHHDDPAQDDHSGIGHALTHCGSGSCSPPYVGTTANVATLAVLSFRAKLWFGDDVFLTSLHLDSDPPCPTRRFLPNLISFSATFAAWSAARLISVC